MPIVCIDPGHGGADPGAVGYVTEKHVVLEIARAAERRLLSCPGVDVVLTRTDDRYLDLSTRAGIANHIGADVLVSIHANAGGGTGFESFRQPGTGANAQRLQQCIHAHIPGLNVKDRGAKEMNLQVLREARMPAVLCECLFVDHPTDAELLKDSRFLRLMGTALADGVADYLGVRMLDKEQDYKANEAFRATVELARAKGLSAPGPGHDYTKPLSEERFWAIIARLLRWQ